MSGARNKTTTNKGGASTRSTGLSKKAESKKVPPVPDSLDYDDDDEDIERGDLEYEPQDAIAEDEEVFDDIPGAERELYGHFDDTPVNETKSSSKKTGKGASHEGNRVLGGFKATLKNPRVSQEAKDHAQRVLEENNAI